MRLKNILLSGLVALAALVPPVGSVVLAQTGAFPYLPQQPTASLSVSNASSNVALPGTGAVIVLSNVGATEAFCAFGTDNTITVDTTGFSIDKGKSRTFARLGPSQGYNFVACITASSTTTMRVEAGSGVPTGW